MCVSAHCFGWRVQNFTLVSHAEIVTPVIREQDEGTSVAVCDVCPNCVHMFSHCKPAGEVAGKKQDALV